MSRATVILRSKQDREKCARWIWQLPDLSRVSFQRPRRSLPQNDALWAMLTEVTEQRPMHQGVKMTPELWKSVFMQALGSEIVFLPTLDGDGMFPIGHRSSELSRDEFSQLIDLIKAWCAQNYITLSDQKNI